MVVNLKTRAESRAEGKAARERVPLEGHRDLAPSADRDPVGLLLKQAESRVPELVPIRHGRMLASPFAFYRGAALPMAADLARLPNSGLRAQLCGDAHLANFGAFASPERRMIFDLNDFDETLPGPFEWYVKRLAASVAVAARGSDFSTKERRTCVVAGVSAYRTAMREFAKMPMLAVWYAHIDVEDAVAGMKSQIGKAALKRGKKAVAKARSSDGVQALSKLTTITDGQRRIITNPPLIVPIEELFPDTEAHELHSRISELVGSYGHTLSSNRRHLLQQFRLLQVARKVVGVGSVGTRAWILLLESADGQPLFLQAKEAQESVLADFSGRGTHRNQGARVVAGQLLMQAASDIFLGWERASGIDSADRDFYVRQLRDWKLSVPIEELKPAGMTVYAGLCGWTLARAHARSGDRNAIAAYLGKADTFDTAVADFAEAYADQNELDHAALATAVADGRAEARKGV
jgi:uncharacterized protein (DUF2252 family)